MEGVGFQGLCINNKQLVSDGLAKFGRGTLSIPDRATMMESTNLILSSSSPSLTYPAFRHSFSFARKIEKFESTLKEPSIFSSKDQTMIMYFLEMGT